MNILILCVIQSEITNMSEPICPQKSPYMKKVQPGVYWWCACGHSKDQPFCDGSHSGTGMGPVKVEITEEKTVAFCGCKKSASGATCDGSHSRL